MGMIAEKTVQEILDTARVEDIIEEFVHLKRRGTNLIGLCPFHNEKTPSFTVSPERTSINVLVVEEEDLRYSS